MLGGSSSSGGKEGSRRHLQMHSMQQFWEFYVTQHSKASTRWWHFVGTASALLLILVAFASTTWWLAPIGITLGYSLAWYSHFFIEGNTPASFGHPFWSFACDWRMFALMLSGRMDAEVQRLQKSRQREGLEKPVRVLGNPIKWGTKM